MGDRAPRSRPTEAERYYAGQRDEIHHQRIRAAQACVKPYWDDSDANTHEAKRVNVKRQQMIQERAHAIDKENMRLLSRLHAIDRKGGSAGAAPPGRPPAGPGKVRSLNSGTRRKEMDRITQENQKMMRRLQSVKSSVGPDQFKAGAVKHKQLVQMRSQVDGPRKSRTDGALSLKARAQMGDFERRLDVRLAALGLDGGDERDDLDLDLPAARGRDMGLDALGAKPRAHSQPPPRAPELYEPDFEVADLGADEDEVDLDKQAWQALAQEREQLDFAIAALGD